MMTVWKPKRPYHKRDRLRQLRAFCQVVRTGSITRAAESLDLGQPAVSLYVRELEHEMEALLFHRSGSRISVTPAGEHLYKLVEPLVQGMDRLSGAFVEQLDDAVARSIQFAVSRAVAGFFLPPYLRRYQLRYPDVRLRVKSCPVSEGVKYLRDNEVDFVLGTIDPPTENEGNIVYHHIDYYDMVLITALDHPLAGRKTVTPEEASAWPTVVPDPASYSRHYGSTVVQRFGIDINVAVEISGWDAIKRYVEEGFGISLVPSLCLTSDDRLSVIPLTEYFPSHSFGVLTRRGSFLPPAAHRLIQLMAPDFQAPLPARFPARARTAKRRDQRGKTRTRPAHSP